MRKCSSPNLKIGISIHKRAYTYSNTFTVFKYIHCDVDLKFLKSTLCQTRSDDRGRVPPTTRGNGETEN